MQTRCVALYIHLPLHRKNNQAEHLVITSSVHGIVYGAFYINKLLSPRAEPNIPTGILLIVPFISSRGALSHNESPQHPMPDIHVPYGLLLTGIRLSRHIQ